MGRGMGFRESNQDLLGFVHMIPVRARSRILDIAATQLPDGSAWHQYQPLTQKGNADIGGGFNDDPLWLVAGVFAYLYETGDDSILREPTQFDNQEGSDQPLLVHLRRSVHFTMTHRSELGEISSYPRGYKENGGIFCHNTPWISIANATIGNDDEAFNVYTRTCPAARCRSCLRCLRLCRPGCRWRRTRGGTTRRPSLR